MEEGSKYSIHPHKSDILDKNFLSTEHIWLCICQVHYWLELHTWHPQQIISTLSLSGHLHFPFRTQFWTWEKVFSVERPPSKPRLVTAEQQLQELKFLSPPCCTSHAPQSCAWRRGMSSFPASLPAPLAFPIPQPIAR